MLDLEKLEHLQICLTQMTNVVTAYSRQYNIDICEYSPLTCFPNILNIREVRHYECVHLCWSIWTSCDKISNFCKTSINVKLLNDYIRAASKISHFLQRHIIANEVFHVVINPKRKCTKFY